MKRILSLALLFCMLAAVLVGCAGTPGKSAYELAVENGFQGTLEEWLASLKGEKGDTPNVTINADGYWVINGTVTDVKATGEKGEKGEDGKTPVISISEDGYFMINGIKTGIPADHIPSTPGKVQDYPYTDEDGVIHIRYQDTYSFPKKIKDIRDVVIHSYVTGTEKKDSALFENKGSAVFAVATGSATVETEDGKSYRFSVDPSPISMLFVSGQSNASGDHASADAGNGRYNQYIRTKDTMTYFTYTYQTLNITGASQIENPNHNNKLYSAQQPEDYVTPTLKWGTNTRYSSNIAGPHISVFDESSKITNFQQAGWCAGLAHEWVAGTGERVWVVNASHGGHPINNFIPERMGGPEPLYNDYEQAVAVFRLALKTLYHEVDAGHFSLSHMAYYWFQGESDSDSDDAYYDEQFAKVHRGLMEDVVYDHNKLYRELEFCGLMTLRSCRDNNGNSERELYMTGPRISQYAMGGTTEGVFSNVYVISNATEEWVGSDENVKNYFLARYGSAEAFEKKFGYPMPNTMQEVHPQIHYFMQGQNEMGMDAGRNSILLLDKLYPDSGYHLPYTEEAASVKLVGVDGVTEIRSGDRVSVDMARGFGYIIPQITPITRAMEGVELRSETPGLTFEGYRLVKTSSAAPSTLKMSVWVGGEKLADYTLSVQYSSSLMMGQRRSHNIYGGDFNPPRQTVYDEDEITSGGWSAGYLDYNSRTFVPFTWVDSQSWLHLASEGENRWGNWHGGFRSSNYALGVSNRVGEGIGFRYIASASGVLGMCIDTLQDKGKTDIAVFVNGRIAWPAGASSDETASGVKGWYRVASYVEREELNMELDTLRVNVEPGDEVVLVFERVTNADGTSASLADQALIYPSVFLAEDATGAITPDRSGTSQFSPDLSAWKAGFFSFGDKIFTPFTATASGNWLCHESDVDSIWKSDTHGAFWKQNNYAIATSPRKDGVTALCYTAERSATYTTSFAAAPKAAQASMDGKACLALFVNGKIVSFPGENTKADDLSTWYAISPATTLEELNAKFAGFSLDLKAGDQVVFAVGRVTQSGQVILVPMLQYGT